MKDIDPHLQFKVQMRRKRGVPTGKWSVWFYRPAPHGHGIWTVGGAQGNFDTREEAATWVQVLRKLHTEREEEE